MTRALTAFCLALLSAAVARAQGEDFRPVPLIMHPAAAPAPALKYRLLPELRDQKPEDAGPLYQKAAKLLRSIPDDELNEWAVTPVKDLPRGDVRQVLDEYREALRLVDRAARCERCDWGLAERIRQTGIATLFPEVEPLGNAARLLAVRARLEIAEGHPDQAIRTLQSGFALGRNLGEAPALVWGLVGNAITEMMIRQLEELMQEGKAPNFYWALTDLPRPFIDMRLPLEGERLTAYGTFPGLLDVARDPKAPPLTPAQIKAAVKILVDNMGRVAGFRNRTVLALMVRNRHEAAKKALIAQGWPRAAVRKMPHMQVALLHAVADYNLQLDEMVKWQTFPSWDARPQIEQAVRWQKEARLRPDSPALPLTRVLLSAIDKVLASRTRVERQFAALRCLEALRLYAAAHGGKLPAALADIKEVPVPPDPFTGQPFRYHTDGNRATLYGPPPAGEKPGPNNALRYEVTLKP